MTLPSAKPAALPVLLIEDEPGVMAYVRAALERKGYAVVCAESGAEGVRILQSGEFLGVVSDMRTPGGVDGADVHAWISKHRSGLAASDRACRPTLGKRRDGTAGPPSRRQCLDGRLGNGTIRSRVHGGGSASFRRCVEPEHLVWKSHLVCGSSFRWLRMLWGKHCE